MRVADEHSNGLRFFFPARLRRRHFGYFTGGYDADLFQCEARYQGPLPLHLLDHIQVFVLSEKRAKVFLQYPNEIVARLLRAGDRRIKPALVLRLPNLGRSLAVTEQCATTPMESFIDEAKGSH